MIENYSLYMLFELKFSVKRLKKRMQQVLAIRQSIFFKNICDDFKIYVKSTEIQFHISSVR